MSLKLQLKATGASGTKTFTIPNPVPVDQFSDDNAEYFITGYADLYGSDLSLAKAVYISTSETSVYPAA